MICPTCNFENPEGMKFCGNCGATQGISCPNCSFENPQGFNFCGHCGTALKHNLQIPTDDLPSKMPIGHGQKGEGERRHLTVMFCDVVGSTALSNTLDPEDLRTIIKEYQEVCRTVVARYEGHIAQYLGDGILVYFGHPLAHENDAHRAVSSGLGILEAMREYNQRLQISRGTNIDVRIGIHTGLVVIGDMGGSGQTQQLALGATPNIAARLEGLAQPNSLLISSHTYELISRFFICDDCGEHFVKGISEAIKVHKVLKENTIRSRVQGSLGAATERQPMEGREEEVKQIMEFWSAAKRGQSRVVMLNGEAGIGKSRIVQAILDEVANDTNAWLMPHISSPYHRQTAYYPFMSGIKRLALNLKGNEPPQEQVKCLERFLLQNELAPDEMVPLFAAAMAMPLDGSGYQPTPFSGQQQRGKISSAILSIILKKAKEQNLLLIFEDLHWCDSSTLGLIGQLIQLSPKLNILTLLSFRPEFTPPWRQQSHLVYINLTSLSYQAVRAIISRIAGGKKLPNQLIDQITNKTDGIPLFVEELTKMVLDSGMVTEHQDRYELTSPIASLAIPSTLHDSLVARLDRMSDTKGIVQVGAVIGREFSYPLIKLATGLKDDTISEGLHQLVNGEILLQEGVVPQATFRFRHALIRDAAYQSLLKSQQQRLHKHTAEVIMDHFPKVADDQPEVAAYHCERGGLTAKAVKHWTEAGDKVRQRQAFDEAEGYLKRAMTLASQLETGKKKSKLELKILAIQAPICLMTAGWGSKLTYQASSRLKELAEELDDKISLFKALRISTTYELFAGLPKQALIYANEALEIAGELNDPELLIEAHRLIGQTCIFVGRLPQSLQSFSKAISLYESTGSLAVKDFIGGNPGIISLFQRANVLWQIGYSDQALERIEEAITIADESKHPYHISFGLFIGALISAWCGRTDQCLIYASECWKLSEEYGLSFFANEAKSYQGYALALKGKVEDGLRLMNEAIAARGLIAQQGAHLHNFALAKIQLQAGDFEAGLTTVNNSLELCEKTGDQCFLSEIYRLKGELLSSKNMEQHLDDIEDCFKLSQEVSRKCGSKSLELRSAISIAGFRNKQGKVAEGLAALSEVYEWFTEGFETKDLIDARGLIDKMTVQTTSVK